MRKFINAIARGALYTAIVVLAPKAGPVHHLPARMPRDGDPEMSTTPNSRVAAERFHEIYERLAPSFGCETRKETRVFDPESPNGKLMMAVCAEWMREWSAQPFKSDSGASALTVAAGSRRVCPHLVDGNCPLHNLHCQYPDCERSLTISPR